MRYFYLLLFALLISVSACSKTSSESKSTAPAADQNLPLAELLLRAEQYGRIGNYELAISDFQRASKLDSLNPGILHSLADAQMDYYQSKKALETMNSAAAKFPRDIKTQLKLSEYYFILQQYDESMKVLDGILKMDPQLDEAYFMMGMNFNEKGDKENALKSFQKTTEVNGDHHDGWLMLGGLYSDQKNDLALKCYENALLVNPNSIEALHNKAFHFQNTERIEEAKKIYKSINAANPQYTDAFFNTGILYLEQDSLELALQHFNIAVKTDPQYAIAYYYMGLTYEKMSNPQLALGMYQQALNLVPDFVRAREAFDYLDAKING